MTIRSLRTTLASTLLVATLATVLAALGPSGTAEAAPRWRSQHRLELVARLATLRYLDVDRAVAAGYEPITPCVEAPGLGAMGIHYMKHDLVDDRVEVTRPEVLLYVPTRHGLRLAGIEYFVPSADQDDSDGLDDGDLPRLGRVPFDGPMAGHGPGEPFHYDLHVWLWSRNPNGTYAQWNPALSCPTAGGTATVN